MNCIVVMVVVDVCKSNLVKHDANVRYLAAAGILIRVLHATSNARNHALSSLQGEKTLRTLPKIENILQRLIKSMPKPSSRIFFWIPSSYVHFVTNN